MKGIGDDKDTVPANKDASNKPVAASKAVETKTESSKEETAPAKVEKKFEGKGLAGVVKKLSEEKLEDKAKRITDKLDNNPDKKDKVLEKEKKVVAKKVVKEEKPAAKKTTKK
jgi:hypothetical protein